LDEAGGAEEVDLELVAGVIEWHVFGCAVEPESGAVDEYVDPALLGNDLLDGSKAATLKVRAPLSSAIEASFCSATTRKGIAVATKSDFTDEEWKALQKGVTGAGTLVSLSDRDFTDSFGEASALAKSLVAQQQGSSELIREIAHTHGTGFGFTSSLQQIETETLAALGTALSALEAKAPEEVGSYQALVLAVADAVAEAKGGVSEQETAALEKIKDALGAQPS